MTRAAKREVAVRWAFAFGNGSIPVTVLTCFTRKGAVQSRRTRRGWGDSVGTIVRIEIPLPRRGKAKP